MGQTGRCTLWLYTHQGGKVQNFRDYLVLDGFVLGRSDGGARSGLSTSRVEIGLPPGWGFDERYNEPKGSSRKADFLGAGNHVTYKLVVGGRPEEEVILERTYEGKWSPGDPLPQPAGY